MPSPGSIITLLTDFGDRDYFVASMKGVILTINPNARIVDLSHQIAPYRIEEAGYFLKSCYRYFPEGTTHVAVVDPGVGTTRRPLLVSTSRYFFLAPDNGLLSDLLEQETGVEVWQIENKQYRLDTAGATFDGRDLFAPAAAWLSKGAPPASFGRLIRDPVRSSIADPTWKNHELVGQIVYVDRFGNLISNLMSKHLNEVQSITKQPVPVVRIGQYSIQGVVANYADGKADHPSVLINSNGWLEVFLRNGNAAQGLGIRTGTEIRLL
jgi:hypothetical protein